MVTMKSNTVTNESKEPVKVLVVLTTADVQAADFMAEQRESVSRSDYIRKLIRADHRKHLRKQQKDGAVVA